MKPLLFRCEYCNFTGKEKEVKEHEEKCLYKYNEKTCLTCKCKTRIVSAKEGNGLRVLCSNGIEVPRNNVLAPCPAYEMEDQITHCLNLFNW